MLSYLGLIKLPRDCLSKRNELPETWSFVNDKINCSISNRMSYYMPYAEVNDIRMYFEETGKGVPLLFMHGATGSADQPENGWSGMIGFFESRYRTIHVEHRGHGRTNNPRDYLTYELIADDVCKFIESMKIERAHLCGLSDGAIVALHIGITRPDLAYTLLCVGANYYNDDMVKEANKFADVAKIERDKPERALELGTCHDRNKQPGYWRILIEQLAANLAVNPAYSKEDLKRIIVPTLLMSGENDLWANPKQMLEMRQNIPISEMLIVNNAGHDIQYTHPHIVGPVIMDFLERYQNLESRENSLSVKQVQHV